MSTVEAVREMLAPTSWQTAAAAVVPAVVIGFGAVIYSPFDPAYAWGMLVGGFLVSLLYLGNMSHPAESFGVGLYIVALLILYLPVHVYVIPLFTDAESTDILVSIAGTFFIGAAAVIVAIVVAGAGYLATRHAEP